MRVSKKYRDVTVMVKLLKKMPEKYRSQLMKVMETKDLKRITAKCEEMTTQIRRQNHE